MNGVILDYNQAAVLASLAKNYIQENASDLTPMQVTNWQELINKLEAN